MICELSPDPLYLKRFRVSADFQLEIPRDPLNPHGMDTQWAATVIARAGSPATIAGATIVGGTHQVLGGNPALITLGAGGGATNTSPQPNLVRLPAPEAHDSQWTFTLGAYLDCFSGEGQSQLSTSGGYYWENRWTHPFTLLTNPPRPVLFVGFGLAMPKGVGTPRVTVKEFRLLIWRKPELDPPNPPVGPILDG